MYLPSPEIYLNFFIVELNDALSNFVKNQSEEYFNNSNDNLIEKAKSGEIDVEEVVKNWEKCYKDKVSEFAEQKGATDEEVFAGAFHQLVHSPALVAILQVESSYACKVQDVTRQRNEDVNKMTNRYAKLFSIYPIIFCLLIYFKDLL